MCLRLIAAMADFHYCVAAGFPSGPSLSWSIIEIAIGLLLCVGLWTPIVGGALSIFALQSAVVGTGDPWPQILLASQGAALAMLGPGAWSIDARLFGRKRLIHEP